MQNKKSLLRGILATCGMLVVILDGKTALNSIQEGLQLCMQTVIPALFPFFVLSGVINSCLFGREIGMLQGIRKLCRIPKGSESLLLIGFLSGYPVGAQLVTQAYMDGSLPKNTAKRMLGFCNNAGPAFLFGMLSPLFANPFVPWALWGIHITGALFASWVLPGVENDRCNITKAEPVTLTQSLQNAIRCMGTVCGWVIVFRLILGFCSRWFLWLFPTELQVLLCGFLELSNGCVMLSKLPLESMRFILASIMLGFGGLCVCMQTSSVTQGLGSGYYFPGKILQTLVSALLSYLLQPLLFAQEERVSIYTVTYLVICITLGIFIYILRRKKVVAFTGRLLYNTTR